MRRVLVAAMAMLLACSAWAVQIDVVITVDNAYGFGFGDANGIATYFGGIRNVLAGEIFSGPPGLVTAPPPSPYTIPGVGPERYQLNLASLDDYVYIVTWSDESTYQGALAGFQLPSGPLLSGAGTWRVFATGDDRDSDIEVDTLTAADLPFINTQIATANANAGDPLTTSVGWVDEFGLLPTANLGAGALALGDFNVAGSFYGLGPIQGISSASRWMWYNEDPASIPDPFAFGPEGQDGHKEFLIFRTQIGQVLEGQVPEPATATLVLAGLAVAAWRRRRRARR
ncbi:MAG TPA: PEP-CTERM sorting domain-containing protein [Planctomycetota bacterium]|nr:PEP-CTERM sorting domain-containing protein [Planctomycetota bacterium]